MKITEYSHINIYIYRILAEPILPVTGMWPHFGLKLATATASARQKEMNLFYTWDVSVCSSTRHSYNNNNNNVYMLFYLWSCICVWTSFSSKLETIQRMFSVYVWRMEEKNCYDVCVYNAKINVFVCTLYIYMWLKWCTPYVNMWKNATIDMLEDERSWQIFNDDNNNDNNIVLWNMYKNQSGPLAATSPNGILIFYVYILIHRFPFLVPISPEIQKRHSNSLADPLRELNYIYLYTNSINMYI